MTIFGKSEFLRLPFDLSQVQDFFICPIYDIFGINKVSMQGQGSRCMAYLDDILIYSRTEKETPCNVRQYLQTFTQSWSQKNQVQPLGGMSILPP